MVLDKYQFINNLPRRDLAIGVFVAETITLSGESPVLDERLSQVVAAYCQVGVSAEQEKMRREARNILKNGKYRPTGRSKPASEYLLRTALEENFPRINPAVDICNYVSLKYLLPISLWDLDLALATTFVFRLGDADEVYTFNSAGQSLKLKDLICGCAVRAGVEVPIVTPVKDSLATKINANTHNLALALYYPLVAGTLSHLQSLIDEIQELFAGYRPGSSGSVVIGN